MTLPQVGEKQKHALWQRNKELERAVRDTNLMILALNKMIDMAENDVPAHAGEN